VPHPCHSRRKVATPSPVRRMGATFATKLAEPRADANARAPEGRHPRRAETQVALSSQTARTERSFSTASERGPPAAAYSLVRTINTLQPA
jgi:hypothetical protein